MEKADVIVYLTQLLTPQPAPEAPPAPVVNPEEGAAPPVETPPVSGLVELPAFEQAVRDLVARQPENPEETLEEALHFIGLDRAREHLGGLGKTVPIHASARVTQGILRGIGEQGMVASPGGDGYVFRMAPQAIQRARLKCGLIARDVSRSFMGSVDTEYVDIVTVALGPDGNIVSDWVTGETSPHAEEHPHAAPEEGAPPEKEPAKPVPKPSAHKRTPFVYDEHAKRFVDLEEFQFIYRPMWQIKNKVISSYLCIPARVAADGAVLIGGAAMPMPYASLENAALDILALKRAVDDLKALFTLGRRLVFVLPVHFVTLNEPRTNRAFLEVCNGVSQDIRKLLVFELLGIPADMPHIPMVRAFSVIRPFCRAILVRRRLDDEVPLKLKEMGVYGIGADIGNYRASEAQIMREMDGFNERVRSFGFSTHLHGVNSRSLISAAVGAGFALIAGDPVMTAIDVPEAASPFDVASLYSGV
jgi:hypothetical protein